MARISVFFNGFRSAWSHKKIKKIEHSAVFFSNSANKTRLSYLRFKKKKKSEQIDPHTGLVAHTIGVFWPLYSLWEMNFLPKSINKLKNLYKID